MEENNIKKLQAQCHAFSDRMRQIRALSSPNLEGIENEEAYSKILRDNFEQIGMLAEENRLFISDVLTRSWILGQT